MDALIKIAQKLRNLVVLNTRRFGSELQNWFFKFIQLPLIIGSLASLLLIGGMILAGFPNLVRDTINWQEKSKFREYGVAAGELYYQLSELTQQFNGSSILKFDKDNFSFDLNVDCAEYANFSNEFNKGLSNSKHIEEARKLIERVCGTDPGVYLRNEFNAWEKNRINLAIRDNRHRTSRYCDDGSALLQHYIHSGCFKNAWLPGYLIDGNFIPKGTDKSIFPAPAIFGFFSENTRLGNGDWQTVNSGIDLNSRLTLQTDLDWSKEYPQDGQLTIEVVGEFLSMTVNGNQYTVQSLIDNPIETIRIELVCDLAVQNDENCINQLRNKASNEIVRGYRIDLVLDRGFHSISIDARPSIAIAKDVLSKQSADITKPNRKDTTYFASKSKYQLTNHLYLECIRFDREFNRIRTGERFNPESFISFSGQTNTIDINEERCNPMWESRTFLTSLGGGKISVNINDGDQEKIAVTKSQLHDGDELVQANNTALNLGLVPILGIDERDSLSILGQLTNQIKRDKELILDLSLDKTAQITVQSVLSDLFLKNENLQNVLRYLPESRDNHRSASVILIDAGPVGKSYAVDKKMGRILASSSFPEPSFGRSEWDLMAQQLFRANQSGLYPKTLNQIDAKSAPGSTFKILLALAAADAAARGRNDIIKLFDLGGGISQDEFRQRFGTTYGLSYSTNKIEVPVGGDDANRSVSIRNFANAPLCQLARGGCGNRLIMRDALRVSSNVWFSRLALMLDEKSISCSLNTRLGISEISSLDPEVCASTDTHPDPALRAPMVLQNMSNHLYNGDSQNLLRAVESKLGYNLRAPIVGSRPYADPIKLDSLDMSRPRRLSLALNGIGQAVIAPPVAMAAIAGSVASGRQIHPRLTLEPPSGEIHELAIAEQSSEFGRADRNIANVLLDEIRDGMKAVVNEPGGTAYRVFRTAPELALRVSGKTGTAQVGIAGSGNTAWFIGWIDGLGQSYLKNRRIAFACSITEISAANGTGGRVCGPIILNILKLLDQSTAQTN